MDEMMKLPVKRIADKRSQEDILVVEAKRDPQAFSQLYDLYVQPVYRYLLSKTGNEQEAEDLTAQTFLAALEGLSRYVHRGNFAAWLFSIARNKSMDFFRKEKREQVYVDAVERSLETAWNQEGSNTDRVLDLSSLIRGLSEEDQELLRLRFVAQMRFKEIAALFGKREDAVKKSIYRLLARLQSQLEDYRE
jgi:RNA polymerase sigma-70 factor (ECF subfamily)